MRPRAAAAAVASIAMASTGQSDPSASECEYRALSEAAILVRRPTPGVLELRGDDAAEFLQGQVTNDIQALAPGEGAYAALLTPKGKMRADMRVLRTAGLLLVVCEPQLLPAIRQTIDTFRIGYRFETADTGDGLELLSLAGPRAHDLLMHALSAAAVPANHENANAPAGDGALTVTTLLGADVLAAPAEADRIVTVLTQAGAVPAAEAVLELARVERGIPRYGFELTEQTIPEEAGLNERAVSFTKGCYVGQETVARLHYKGKPNRRLRGLAAPIPLAGGTSVLAADGRELGVVGTAVISPSRGPLALALLRREAEPGDEVTIGGIAARVTSPGTND